MKLKYNYSQLCQLNTPILKSIPDDPTDTKYVILRQFVESNYSKLVSTCKKPVIPLYLKEKYGHDQLNKFADARNNPVVKPHRIKNPNHLDKLNTEVREILTKLSERNKYKLYHNFYQLDLTNLSDEVQQMLIENIYTFTIDLAYTNVLNIYVKLILILKLKNPSMFNILLTKIVDTVKHPLIFKLNPKSNPVESSDEEASDSSSDHIDVVKSRRWRLANVQLLGQLYHLITYQSSTPKLETIYELFKDIQSTFKAHKYTPIFDSLIREMLDLVTKKFSGLNNLFNVTVINILSKNDNKNYIENQANSLDRLLTQLLTPTERKNFIHIANFYNHKELTTDEELNQLILNHKLSLIYLNESFPHIIQLSKYDSLTFLKPSKYQSDFQSMHKYFNLPEVTEIIGTYDCQPDDHLKELNTHFNNVFDFLYHQINVNHPESIELLCELIKHSQVSKQQLSNQQWDNLSKLSSNRDYELRYRFMLEDLLDLLECDQD